MSGFSGVCEPPLRPGVRNSRSASTEVRIASNDSPGCVTAPSPVRTTSSGIAARRRASSTRSPSALGAGRGNHGGAASPSSSMRRASASTAGSINIAIRSTPDTPSIMQ